MNIIIFTLCYILIGLIIYNLSNKYFDKHSALLFGIFWPITIIIFINVINIFYLNELFKK